MKGVLSAYAGIDPENKEKTMTALLQEVENIRAGKISEEELSDAKKSYVNRMKEIEDNPSLLPSYYHIRLESDLPRTPLGDAEAIMKLTVEDVVEASKNIKLDTVYFLTKEEEI
jgi:predicted Zn-dependent peptidase